MIALAKDIPSLRVVTLSASHSTISAKAPARSLVCLASNPRGGAPGSGGPKGPHNSNYKHGLYTAEAIASRRWLRRQIREATALTNLGQDEVGS
jgi:hypothetical protein